MELYTSSSKVVGKAARDLTRGQQGWYFSKGLRQGLPIALGYFPSALAFGVMALAAGLTPKQTILISVLVFSGAGQFMAVNLLSGGAPPLAIITANLVVNLRYFVMSASFSRRLKVNWLQAALIGFGVTDETFVMNYLADPEAAESDGNPLDDSGAQKEKTAFLPVSYVLGVNSISYAGWVLGTYAGTLFAGVLPDSFRAAMGIILYAMFIALLIPAAAETLAVGGVAAAGGALCWLFSRYLPSGWAVVLATTAAAAVGVILWGKGVDEL
ncbi:MAG: AzlC family ABC transporter permease [Firmicutes bacterium]|jgi:4-azaleucine resistance transporter AzlC|nr:AzlC family ABC transporter permease [Bacillota bacterium]